MRDIVLKGFVNDFAENRGLTSLPDSEIFEAFATSTILRKFHQTDSSDVDELSMGMPGDGGLDAAVVLVNGRSARSTEDIDFFVEKIRRLDVEFVFVQAKTGRDFNAGEIGTFIFGVKQFFSTDSEGYFHREIENIRRVKDYIYEKSAHMDKNPVCAMYYVGAGEWKDGLEPRLRLDDGCKQIQSLNLFSAVEATPVDAEMLKIMYRELGRGITREVEFSRLAVFPRISGVQEAYTGLLSGEEFIRLVTTDDGSLNREIFYDNVRDFQGHNPVNNEIAQTVATDDSRDRFPLFNNGVTIVARTINRRGDTFNISDFQIVNGCQTTHILYQYKHKMDSETHIPVKLVVTNESEVITEVIKATNRQTAVLPEALESLSPFHRELEDFYNTCESKKPGKDRIYYERRSKQYAFDGIMPTRIVTLTRQINSFVAMFLDEPHSTHRYYGEILKAYEGRLFNNDHNPAPYYASGCALMAIERLFASGEIDVRMRKWKFHVLTLLKVLIGGRQTPRMNSRNISDYALNVVEAVKDEKGLIRKCNIAIDIIEGEIRKVPSPPSLDQSRVRAFTLRLFQSIPEGEVKGESHGASTNLGVDEGIDPERTSEVGEIAWYDVIRGFGVIKRDLGGEIFVHHNGIKRNFPWRLRIAGTRVRYHRRISRRESENHRWVADNVDLE